MRWKRDERGSGEGVAREGKRVRGEWRRGGRGEYGERGTGKGKGKGKGDHCSMLLTTEEIPNSRCSQSQRKCCTLYVSER